MRLPALLVFAVVTAGGLNAQATGLSLRIETDGGQTQYRMGEAVVLKLTFENASGDGWRTNFSDGDRTVLGFGSDRFVASPASGTSDSQRYRLSEGFIYAGFGGLQLAEKTTVAHTDLNQWLRFERPGHYIVRASIHATDPQHGDVVLDSNDVEVEIIPADAKWQADQLREYVNAVDTVNARRLWYLDTADSVRESARLLGTADDQVAGILQTGLRASRHADEAIVAMKELLRDPDQPVTPIFLDTLAALQAYQLVPPPDDPAVDSAGLRRNEACARAAEQLRSDLAVAIEKKRALAKAVSLNTLLDHMPAEAVPSNLRSEIASLFTQLPERQQSNLLDSRNGAWKKIAGPEMIPVLRKIYDTGGKDETWRQDSLVATAVERLYELDPAQARPLLIDEMSRPAPRLPFGTLAMLSDATLPQLDKTLSENLVHSQSTQVEELIARYATGGILETVRAYYLKRDAEMRSRTSANIPNIASPACEPPLVAYFLRVDPAWGEQLLRQSLGERSFPFGRCWMTILGKTGAYYAGPEWEKTAILALQDPTVIVKSDAVKALGQHGSADSAAMVWEAFRYWHDWWKDRPTEMNEENRQFERAFVEAITHSKNWIAGAGEGNRIRDLCVTQDCRARAEEYLNTGR